MSHTDDPPNILEIFYAYSPKDEKLKETLEVHLSTLQPQSSIVHWCDRKIAVGQDWKQEVVYHLNTAQVILLLISPNFLASEFYHSAEMQRALERQKQGNALVIPIILRPTSWQDTPIGALKALPTDGRPILTWRKQDEAFYDVTKHIQNAISERFSFSFFKSPPDKVALKVAYAAAQQQQAVEPVTEAEIPIKLNLREKIITEYDLEKAMAEFKRPLMQGRAFGFTVAGEMVFLKDYVIQRIRHEFQKEIPGDIHKLELILDVQDLQRFTTVQTLLEDKIKREFNYQKVGELITRHPKEHVMLILWNYDLPSDKVEEIVAAFWQRFVPCIKEYLRKKSLCFLLILAHSSPASDPCIIEGFHSLELEAIDVQGSVIPFLKRRFSVLNVSSRDESLCLGFFEHEASISRLQLLLKMERIVTLLQGKYDGKHDLEKSYTRRGRSRRW